jgi:hypothetical protein
VSHRTDLPAIERGPRPGTRRAGIATSILGLLDTVAGVVALLADPALVLPAGVIVVGGAVVFLAGAFLVKNRNVPVKIPLWAVGLGVLAMVGLLTLTVVTIVLSEWTARPPGASGATPSGPGQSSPTPAPSGTDSPDAEILTPGSGERFSLPAVVQLTGVIANATPDYCRNHHLWLVSAHPGGRNGQVLYAARTELRCRNGGWRFRDEFRGAGFHEYTVRAVADAAGQEYMTVNKDFVDRRDYSRDGDWVQLPARTELISNPVRVLS